MTNLSEESTFHPGITQIETTDKVIGGPDGKSNEQGKQLGDRTRYLKDEVEKRAPLESPAFTGTPTAPTAAPTTNNTMLANTAFVIAEIAAAVNNILNAPPATLDTLNELAQALGDDPNFAATIANQLGLKAPLASPALTGAPTAPTRIPGTNDTTLANTAFVTAAISAAAAAFSMTPAEILALLITVDGAGSNLDADLLDGLQSAQFSRVDAQSSHTAKLLCLGDLNSEGVAGTNAGALEVRSLGSGGTAGAARTLFHRPSAYSAHLGLDTDNQFKIGGGSMGTVAHKIWHQGLVTNLLAANGYVVLPNQMIIQWGKKTGAATNQAITFPLAFTAVLSVTGSPNDGGNSAFAYDGLSPTGFTGHVDRLSDSVDLGSEWTWIAIGY